MAAFATVARALVGRTLASRYLLGDPIATGATACVYRAHSVYLDAPIAVKVLHETLAASPASRERFRREAHLAAQIAHPNIVTVLDFGETDDGLLFMVMELVSGRSLTDRVRIEGAQPLARIVPLMQQLLAALGALHAGGIAHGDVKSDNLVVRPDRDGGDALKLVDFGLASRVARAASDARSAQEVSGTPGYIAPERIGGAPVSSAADVYAAGVVLYELLTGERPFAGPSVPAILERQLAGELVPPSELKPGLAIAPALDALVAWALDPDPARRPPAAALEVALAAVAPGERSTVARPPSGAAAAPEAPTMFGTGTAPTSVSRVDRHRDAIGRAMRSGAVDSLAELYMGLATLLRAFGDVPAAEAELAEAVDVVTCGAGAGATSGPDDLWRLLLMLGELQSQRGQWAAARVSVGHAYAHADRVGSTLGRARAEERAAFLHGGTGRASAQAGSASTPWS